MKIIKGIINVLTTLIIVIGGLFLLLFAIGFTPYVVLSGSMEPEIKTGSICFINRHASYDDIKENDIIAFKLKGGTLVTHRVVDITNDGIVTKGDNNEKNDDVITTKNNFVGKNTFWIPKVGYLVVLLQKTKGKIIFITYIILLVVAGLLFGEDKKKENN